MDITMAWTTYVYDSLLITLKPGFSNNIRFAVKTSDFGNLDEIVVRPVTITGLSDKYAEGKSKITAIYPNPFIDQTRIEYNINEYCSVRIELLNMTGHVLTTLSDSKKEPGKYELVWDGLNTSGHKVPAGIYYCTLVINSQKVSLKKVVVLVK